MKPEINETKDQRLTWRSTAMLRIANDPAMVMPVTVVIVVPIPLAGLDYTGSGESDQGEHEAAAHKAPRSCHSWISHAVTPLF
jgi:hypothetical protein